MKQKDIVVRYNSGTEMTPVWAATAKTLTSLPLSLNATTEDIQFIEDATGTTIVQNFNPSYAYTARPADTDPSALDDKLWEVHKKQLTDETIELLVVYLKKAGSQPNTFSAHRGSYKVVPDSGPSGDAGSNVELTGNLNQSGDLVHGDATLTGDVWSFVEVVESES